MKKNGTTTLNCQLPEIKSSNRISKSITNEKNGELVKKIMDKNIIKYQRSIDIINHIKNWSRNVSINFKKKKSSTSKEDNIITNKFSSIINNINGKHNSDYNNLTLNFTLKENKLEHDLNKNNYGTTSNLIKLNKGKNSILNNSNIFQRTILNSIGDVKSLNEKNEYNSNKKYININTNRYMNSLSDHNTPNLIKQKNIFGQGGINIGKINLIKTFTKDNLINSDYINSRLDKNLNERNSCNVNLNNNRKFKLFLMDNESTHNIAFSNNNLKEVNLEKDGKKIKKNYFIGQKAKLGKNSIINNIKYKLIVPGMINSSTNNKKLSFKSLEDDKKSININNQTLLKDLRNHLNLNNVNNFIMILKQHIIIENEFNNIIEKASNQNDNNDKVNLLKTLINQLNIFFNQLNDISFEINIFLDKQYNSLLQKIIELIIFFHCLIFIKVSLYDINSFILNIKINSIDILNNISFCFYNIFQKYILADLKKNKYNDLSFIDSLNNLYTINPKYNMKSTLSNSEVFSILQKNYNKCVEQLIKKINNNNTFIKEILNSIKILLLDINKKDILYYIDICLNNILYTLLNKNIQKAIFNSNYTKNSLVSNSVPYLPPLENSKYKYTVVLDMDETLGHLIYNEIKVKDFCNYGYLIENDKNNFNKISDNKEKLKVGIFLIRPFAKFFLEELNNLCYEIVIFTAGTKEYCDKILDIFDINNNLIKYRLYRSHISLRNINNDVKDLSLLGRDLNKIIMIDNLPENYKLQQDNGLPINSWTGDLNDTSLKDLLPIMKYIVEQNVTDVRDIIRKVKIQLINNSKIKYYDYGKINLKF